MPFPDQECKEEGQNTIFSLSWECRCFQNIIRTWPFACTMHAVKHYLEPISLWESSLQTELLFTPFPPQIWDFCIKGKWMGTESKPVVSNPFWIKAYTFICFAAVSLSCLLQPWRGAASFQKTTTTNLIISAYMRLKYESLCCWFTFGSGLKRILQGEKLEGSLHRGLP